MSVTVKQRHGLGMALFEDQMGDISVLLMFSKTECGYLHGRVPENGRTCNPLALWTAPIQVQVWVHILGDPQIVQLRNATTATCL